MRCRASGPALARPARPPAADDVPVPPQDGARGDDQLHRGETVDRQRPGHQGKQRPVRPRQPGTSPRPLTPGDSELAAQHEDLGVLPPRLPARQAEQRHGTGNDQEDQLQAHEPKIIPSPVGPRPARRMPNAPARSAGPLPRWHKFSALSSNCWAAYGLIPRVLAFGQDKFDGRRLAGGEVLEGAGETPSEPSGRLSAQVFPPSVGGLLLLRPDVADRVAAAGQEDSPAGCVLVDDPLKLSGMPFLDPEHGGDSGDGRGEGVDAGRW